MLEGQEEEEDDNEDIIVCLEKMGKNIIEKEMWEETKRNNKTESIHVRRELVSGFYSFEIKLEQEKAL